MKQCELKCQKGQCVQGCVEQQDGGADTTAEGAAKEVIFTGFQGWGGGEDKEGTEGEE